MDRLSSLPSEIICHIGSFLSAKEAVFIMVLSKKWLNLFTIIPKLHFDGSSLNNVKGFKDLVKGVLALPATSRIRKFSLKWDCIDVDPALYEHVNRCLCHVLKRGVLVLELKINVNKGYSLPLDVFTCKTVAKMKLGSGFVINILPENALLPALKTLTLDSVRFYDFGRCAFKKLLSASPVLEELVIDGVEWERWKWSGVVASPTLQRLYIRRQLWFLNEVDESLDPRGLPYNNESISLDTPSLTYLQYSDFVHRVYPIVNLHSLVEVMLNLCVDEERLWDDRHADDFDPTNLINGLKNIEVMDLTFETLEMISIFNEATPVFENLFHVSVRFSNLNFCWHSMPALLKKCPNLKTLIIQDGLHYPKPCYIKKGELVCKCVSEYSFLWSCHVEVLKIKVYRGSIEELEQMKHFLEKLSCLEMVKVHAQAKGDKKVHVLADLLMLPRASSKCKIKVKFSE